MKKKIIASLLLVVFVNNIVSAEKIIFNTQGVPIKNSQNINLNQKDTAVDNSKRLSENYEEKNKKNLEQLPTKIDGVAIAPLIASQNDGISASFDTQSKSVKGRIELPWYNGNYIVWNTKMAKDAWYTGEFDLNKNQAGFVIIIEARNVFVCADYIQDSDSLDYYQSTVFIYYKDSHKAGFLYDAENNLMMSKIDNNVNVVNNRSIKNPDFINKIIPIFDNPQAAVKANVKYSEKKEVVQTITNKPKINLADVNYKASSFNMDLGQAVSYYVTNVDNNPEAIKLYNLLPDLDYNRYSPVLTSKHPASYFEAIEEGLIPKYLSPSYKLGENQVMMDSTLEIYRLMKQNNFSEQKIKNFLYFYKSYCFKDTKVVSMSEIKNIMNNSLLKEEEKFYYVIAKLYALHYNNPKIEEDIINSYKLLRDNPEIVSRGLDLTELHDEIFRIINYYPEACKTEESIKTALNAKSLSDGEKFYKILGLLKKETLMDEYDNSCPQQLYDIAETGIMALGFNSDAKEFYKKETVLNDVLSASKLLMKSKFWTWVNPELDGNDFLTIAPELCLTTKVVTEVLNDKSIQPKDREEIISNRLYQEKALANDKNEYDYNKTSKYGYELIKKGYVTRGYVYSSRLIYDDECKLANDFLDLLVKNSLNPAQIKDIWDLSNETSSLRARVVARANEINKLPQNEKAYKIKRMLIEETNFKYPQAKTNILSLYDNRLLENSDNLKDILSDYYSNSYAQMDVEAYISLKNIEGFSEKDISKFISQINGYFKLDKDIINTVLKDKNIKPKDRPAFVYALAKQNDYKCEVNKTTPKSYYKAIDEGIIPLYYSENDKNNEFYEDLIEMYKYMKYNLNYNGKQVDEVTNYLCIYPYLRSDKILAVVKNDKLNYEQKTAKLVKMKKSQEKSNDNIEFMKKLPMNILKIVTFPIWIIPVLILNWLISSADWR